MPHGVKPLFIAQLGVQHFLSSELVPTTRRRTWNGTTAAESSTSGQGDMNETPTISAAPETHFLPTVCHNRPTRSTSRTGSLVPPTLLPRNTRNLNHFPIADSGDRTKRVSRKELLGPPPSRPALLCCVHCWD